MKTRIYAAPAVEGLSLSVRGWTLVVRFRRLIVTSIVDLEKVYVGIGVAPIPT